MVSTTTYLNKVMENSQRSRICCGTSHWADCSFYNLECKLKNHVFVLVEWQHTLPSLSVWTLVHTQFCLANNFYNNLLLLFCYKYCWLNNTTTNLRLSLCGRDFLSHFTKSLKPFTHYGYFCMLKMKIFVFFIKKHNFHILCLRDQVYFLIF